MSLHTLNHKQLISEYEKTIVSVSGWRKVFASNGDEENDNPELNPVNLALVYVMAKVIIDFFKARNARAIVLGSDSRPTGPAIMKAITQIAQARKQEVILLGISAAPEIMAYAKTKEDCDGFIYISASHNPIGHNGLKVGDAMGGVLPRKESLELIEELNRTMDHPDILSDLGALLSSTGLEETNQLLPSENTKSRALDIYHNFTDEVFWGNISKENRLSLSEQFTSSLQNYPFGIVADFNGSARASSIDRKYFESLGLGFTSINDTVGRIAHRIVPEGESLNYVAEELVRQHQKDSSFLLGYMPDNDGDRGNIVLFDETSNGSRILEAQELFALICLSELSWLKILELNKIIPEQKTAVVVNGPTSHRIEELSSYFGVSVFRAEVGEANVVGLADSLRQQGWRVRLLGEGSNGGNISHPARVRDPINSLLSLARLYVLRFQNYDPFALYCRLSKQSYRNDFKFVDLLDALPKYVSTSSYERRALMQIQSKDHGALKSAYEKEFPEQWDKLIAKLRKFGIESWKEINYEGFEAKEGVGPQFRSGAQRGGLKIELLDQKQQYVASLWMRGSGTEPVFRILVDVKGSRPELESLLLDWHQEMIERADKLSSSK